MVSIVGELMQFPKGTATGWVWLTKKFQNMEGLHDCRYCNLTTRIETVFHKSQCAEAFKELFEIEFNTRNYQPYAETLHKHLLLVHCELMLLQLDRN